MTTSCRKWILVDSVERKEVRAQPLKNSPIGVSFNRTKQAPPPGHVRIGVELLKAENEANFQNCLTIEVDRAVEVPEGCSRNSKGGLSCEVGCNKTGAPMRFLETKASYDIKVSDGEKPVTVNLSYQTTEPASSDCILYSSGDSSPAVGGRSCPSPFPGLPETRSFESHPKSFKCYKEDELFLVYYEDQKPAKIDKDAALRQQFLAEKPASFDPRTGNRDSFYQFQPQSTLPISQQEQNCLASGTQAGGSGQVSEATLQRCLGVDWKDFAVSLQGDGTTVSFGGRDACR